MAKRIVLYTDSNRASPYAERVELALKETGAEYSTFMIDLKNKPEFYKEKINPWNKIPALTYGGPDVPPDQPAAESAKIAESLVILEFIADLFPASGLLPADPVDRAKVRFFVDAASAKVQVPLFDFLLRGGSADSLLAALQAVQALLPVGAQLAVGDKFTIADATLAPMLWRFEIALKAKLGKYDAVEGKRVLDAYEGEQLAVLRRYFEAIKARKNFKETVQSAEQIIEIFTKRSYGARD